MRHDHDGSVPVGDRLAIPIEVHEVRLYSPRDSDKPIERASKLPALGIHPLEGEVARFDVQALYALDVAELLATRFGSQRDQRDPEPAPAQFPGQLGRIG